MIDVIRQQFKEGMSLVQKENLVREFLQILCLKLMGDRKAFDDVAFLGGTSLRILFNMRRFSEDLDFSLIKPGPYDVAALADQIVTGFRLNGFSAEAKVRKHGAVHGFMLKFDGLLKELEISPMSSQKLSIKLEIDTNPPEGWGLTRTLVNKTFLFTVNHYDLPSLFAGKLHACLYREYVKGRDFYDLAWYVGRKVQPNFELLNNAIRQTKGIEQGVNASNFKDLLLQRVQSVDLDAAKKDVERFLEDKGELSLFDVRFMSDFIKGMA
jgi:predicted nucleotidyltransferase component of viral defense system